MMNQGDRPAADLVLTPVQQELRRRISGFLVTTLHVKGRLGSLSTALIERCLGFRIEVKIRFRTLIYNTLLEPTAAQMALLDGLPGYLRTGTDLGGMYTSTRGITSIYQCPTVMATQLDQAYYGHDWCGAAISLLESLVAVRLIQDRAINYRIVGQQMILAGMMMFHRGWSSEESAAIYKSIIYSCEWTGNLRVFPFDILIYELQQRPLLDDYLRFLDDGVAAHVLLNPRRGAAIAPAAPPPAPGPQPDPPQIPV